MNLQVEEQPAYASTLFGERISIASEYVKILVRDSDRLGLLGPREFPKIWTRHVAHCALLSEMIREPAHRVPSGEGEVLDLGSGAGLPGIPLAIALPQTSFTLLEPMERRADWLRLAIAELGLPNVQVTRARAEEHRGTYRIVTARAVAPLRRLIALASPLLSHEQDAALLFIKGRSVNEEIGDALRAVQKEKLATPEVFILGRDLRADPLTVVRIARVQ